MMQQLRKCMTTYIKPLLKKCPKSIMLHIGQSLKAYVEKALPDCISNLTLRADIAKASLTINNVDQHL